MPRLDGKGPLGEGYGTGRKLGKCSSATNAEKLEHLGKGMGKRRNSGGGEGHGKRLKSGLENISKF